MASNKSSGRITVANIIAIVGLVLLAVFSFLGMTFKSGGEMGWAVVIAMAVTAVTAFLLWFLIKAKGVENELEKWRKIEYATLATYIVVAILTTIFGGVMHFFVINGNKEQMRQYAKEDLEAIESHFTDYENFWEDAIEKTKNGYELGKSHLRSVSDPALIEFIEETPDIETYKKGKERKLFKEGIVGTTVDETQLYNLFKSDQTAILSDLESWSVFKVSSDAKKIADYAEKVPEALNQLSAGADIKEIDEDGNKVIGQYSKEFSGTDLLESLKFKKGLQTIGFSLMGLAIALLIHFLILFNYIVAYRTYNNSIKKNAMDDGGQILYQ